MFDIDSRRFCDGREHNSVGGGSWRSDLHLLNTNREGELPEQLTIEDVPLVLPVFCSVRVSTLVLLLNS